MKPPDSNVYLALQEFVSGAKERLPSEIWNYIIGGTETETTLYRNRLCLDSLALKPGVLNDVSEVSCQTELLGRNARLPVLLAPIGGIEAFHTDGMLGLAEAARDFGVPMLLSSVSNTSMQTLVENLGSELTLVYQLYARQNATAIDELLELTTSLKLPAFCITVDSAHYSRRERDILARFTKPWKAKVYDEEWRYQASLNWSDIKRIRATYAGQLILKGIATPADALKAVDHGVDIIYVSNHGGRQLDHVQGSTTMLQEIAEVIGGQARLYVDGGYYRGTDIAKARVLGADGVGLGRMMCFAFAAAGGVGVLRMLEILEEEYRIALALLGVTCDEQLNDGHLGKADPVHRDHPLFCAFPLLKDADFKL